MKILALEFSTKERSVALVETIANGEPTIIGTLSEADFRGVTGISLIDRLLRQCSVKPAEVGAIAVGLGPGSYTGIRSAIALAQGWQIGREIKLLGVSSVEVIAENAREKGMVGEITIVVDAQRGEVYRAKYAVGSERVKEVEPLQIISPRFIEGSEPALGPEASKFVPGATDLNPSAAVLAKMAARRTNFVRGEQLEPIYLRPANFVKAAPARMI